MRLFVALTLPDGIRAELARLCYGLPGARWGNPDNMHVTLRFIGEVDNPSAEDIDSALGGIHAPGFPVTLSGMGSFGSAAKVRAAWVGIEAPPALNVLREKIESAS